MMEVAVAKTVVVASGVSDGYRLSSNRRPLNVPANCSAARNSKANSSYIFSEKNSVRSTEGMRDTSSLVPLRAPNALNLFCSK